MKANTTTKVHIGGSLRENLADFSKDVSRYEQGERVTEDHLTFENWQALFNVLTPKRYELLQHVHQHPEPSIRSLSRALDRDFKRVQEDVHALVAIGLLERSEGGLKVGYDVIETRIPLGSAG